MIKIHSMICSFAILASTVGSAKATVTGYWNEVDYLADVVALGVTVVHEGFEDDAAWEPARGTAAPSVENLGITWTANNDHSGVVTGSGPALTGDFGFFTLPHGDFANGIGDGFVGTSNVLLYGVGGWIVTNTPPAGISLVLDADSSPTVVDFGEDCDPSGENCIDRAILGTAHKFFGVISTDGFSRFDFLETEFTLPDETKYIFADDFTIAGDLPAALAGDYNDNGTVDAADYTVWRDALAAGATSLTNDPTPGIVDESDFTYWRAHFGETLGGGAGARQAAVPEPTSLAMFLMATLAILSRRSRQFHQLVWS